MIPNAQFWPQVPEKSGLGLLLWTQGLDKNIYVACTKLDASFLTPSLCLGESSEFADVALHFLQTDGRWKRCPDFPGDEPGWRTAAPLFKLPLFASLSVMWIQQLRRWVMLYTRARPGMGQRVAVGTR